MKRRDFLQTGALSCALAIAKPGRTAAAAISSEPPTWQPPAAFEFEELTISELQQGMAKGEHTAKSLVKAYLERIADLDKKGPAVNAVIEINPDAQAIAEALDRERKAKGARGPLHGIPILIKDNIDTADRMMTTAGSLALLGSIASQDAFIVKKCATPAPLSSVRQTSANGQTLDRPTRQAVGADAVGRRRTLMCLTEILAARVQVQESRQRRISVLPRLELKPMGR